MTTTLRDRVVLTFVWLFFVMLAIAVVESYVHVRTPEGKRFILPEDRNDFLPSLLEGYAAYVAAVLAFWFLKPFSPPKSDVADKSRFWIALACTLCFNGTILFFLLNCYFVPPSQRDFAGNTSTAISLMKWLSFIVAPVNVFYFGAKSGG